MHGAHPLGDLAPRDIVARAIAAEMRRTGADHVLLDISHADPAFVAARFPGVYAHCLRYELDITRRAAPVAPAAHYLMGGVYTDIDGRTTLPGLLRLRRGGGRRRARRQPPGQQLLAGDGGLRAARGRGLAGGGGRGPRP